MSVLSSIRATPESGTPPVRPLLMDRRPTRRVWGALLLWTAAWSLVQGIGGLYSWHYFVTGGTALLHPGATGSGLHVYAAHPELQMGPLTLGVAAALVAVGGAMVSVLAALVMTLLGALNLWLLVTLRAHLRSEPVSPRVTLYAGLLLIPMWSVLSVHFGHLDDVLALTLTTGALVALVRNRPWATVVLLAAATSAKPWALPFAVLLLVEPVGRVRRVSSYLGLCALPWLPFLIADRHTVAISSFTIVNAPDSALRALGVSSAHTPAWDRTAQVVLALALALWCLRIAQPLAIPAVVLATRMLLDPGTYSYYTSGLVLVCLYVDLTYRRRKVPWTAAAVVAWWVTDTVLGAVVPAGAAGAGRAIFLLGLLLALLVKRPAHTHAPPAEALPGESNVGRATGSSLRCLESFRHLRGAFR